MAVALLGGAVADIGADSANPPSLTLTTPSGTADGDLVIATLFSDDQGGLIAPAEAGWNVLFHLEHTNDELRLGAWWRNDVVGAIAYGFDYDANFRILMGALTVWTGAHPTTPIDDSLTFADGGVKSTVTCPSVDGTFEGALLCYLGEDAVKTWTPPGSLSELWDVSDATDGCSWTGAYQLLGATEATGTRVFTASANTDFQLGASIAIRPNPGVDFHRMLEWGTGYRQSVREVR